MKLKEIENIQSLKNELNTVKKFEYYAFQDIDFYLIKDDILKSHFSNCLFMGCNFDKEIKNHISDNNVIFPKLDVPFNTFPSELYTKDTLFKGYIPGIPDSYSVCYDKIVYQHYLKIEKEEKSIFETLAQRLHDHSMTDALTDFLSAYNEKKVVAIMGGHNAFRDSENYKKGAVLSKALTESGHLMCSGGGPGAMEATHLGAWFAGRSKEDLEDALKILAKAPDFKDKNWLEMAFQVIEKFPKNNEYESLGIPTWFYGHEPPTPFASKIAKYFANSVREDGLLTIAKGGIIFTPGAAGTLQEIFQDLAQNHYRSIGYESPMIFYDVDFWTNEVPVYPFLKQLIEKGKYKHLMISITDSTTEIFNILDKFK
jgi:predicted Rossmann-fold nucleotide-binding protein